MQYQHITDHSIFKGLKTQLQSLFVDCEHMFGSLNYLFDLRQLYFGDDYCKYPPTRVFMSWFMQLTDGCFYQGEFNQSRQPDGRIIKLDPLNSTLLLGRFKNGHPHGLCTLVTKDGFYTLGNYSNGLLIKQHSLPAVSDLKLLRDIGCKIMSKMTKKAFKTFFALNQQKLIDFDQSWLPKTTLVPDH
jgi:hypothetical protein